MRENCVEVGVLQLIDWRKGDNQNENLAEVVDVKSCMSTFSLANLKPAFQTQWNMMQVQTKPNLMQMNNPLSPHQRSASTKSRS